MGLRQDLHAKSTSNFDLRITIVYFFEKIQAEIVLSYCFFGAKGKSTFYSIVHASLH